MVGLMSQIDLLKYAQAHYFEAKSSLTLIFSILPFIINTMEGGLYAGF